MTDKKRDDALRAARDAFDNTTPGSPEEKAALEKWVALYETERDKFIPFSAYQRRLGKRRCRRSEPTGPPPQKLKTKTQRRKK